MTRLEDALREALDAELRSAPTGLLEDVRRGVRRRRLLRTFASAAAAAGVIAGLAVSGAVLTGTDDTAPQPATSPTETVPTGPSQPAPTDSPPPTTDVPTRVTAMAVGGGLVFVLAHETAGEETTLWRLKRDVWERLNEFPTGSLERLAFTPDGRNGWASGNGTPLWATHDGGDTWARPALGSDNERGMSFWPAATSTTVWLVDLTGDRLWRAPVGSDDFVPATAGGRTGFSQIDTVGDAVVLTAEPVGEGNVTSVPLVSRDDGITWTELPFPCHGENRLLAADDAVFALCPDGGNAATVYRSVDLATWQEFGRSRGARTDTVPLADDRILLRGQDQILMTEDGATPIKTGLRPGRSVWGTAQIGDQLFLGTDGGVLVSDDGGLTWRAAK